MESVILPTFDEMLACRTLTAAERAKDIKAMKDFDGLTSGIKLAGNKYLQHYFFSEIAKVKFDKKPSLHEVMQDETLKQKLYKNTITKDKNLPVDMMAAYTRMNPVCLFKPSIAKFLYTKFKPTSVLDPTAGWGGRMLGAVASNIKYTGIDTNLSLKPKYEAMMAELNGNTTMIWESCLDVDFSKIDYDMVLTSPPYINKELYEFMKPFESSQAFYKTFLIPLITKCLAHVKNNGPVCINVNPEYYEALLQHGFRKADEIVHFQQSTRQDKQGKTKLEYVYVWRNQGTPQPEIINLSSICKVGETSPCLNCSKLEEENRILRKKIEQLKLLI